MPAAGRGDETRELSESPRCGRGEKKRKSPRCAGGGGGGGGGSNGILNLGGSIDFTIWTPPKVKNKPSRTYSTLIECLSSARLVSTHRPPEREKERERGRREETKQEETAVEGKRNEKEGTDRREERGWKRARERQRKGVIKRRKGGGRRATEEEGGGEGERVSAGGDRREKSVAKYRSSTPGKKQRTEN